MKYLTFINTTDSPKVRLKEYPHVSLCSIFDLIFCDGWSLSKVAEHYDVPEAHLLDVIGEVEERIQDVLYEEPGCLPEKAASFKTPCQWCNSVFATRTHVDMVADNVHNIWQLCEDCYTTEFGGDPICDTCKQGVAQYTYDSSNLCYDCFHVVIKT